MMNCRFSQIAFALLALLSGPGAYASGSFSWCRSLNEIPAAELNAAKVPALNDEIRSQSHRHEDGNWTFKMPLEEVWDIYTRNPLRTAWKSKLIQYLYAVDPMTGAQVDESLKEKWPGLVKGLRFYLNILADPLGRFCQMGMGVEVTEVKPLISIRYEYLDFSPAFGTQWIYFEKLGPELTRVRHVTEYKGKDFVVDKTYMHFHGEAIPAFHNSVKDLVIKGLVVPSPQRFRHMLRPVESAMLVH